MFENKTTCDRPSVWWPQHRGHGKARQQDWHASAFFGMEPLPTNDVLVLNDISDGAFWFDSLGEGDLAELLRLAEPELGADAASVQPNSNEPGHHSNCALELDETTAAPAAKSKRRGRKKTVTAEERRRKNREIQVRGIWCQLHVLACTLANRFATAAPSGALPCQPTSEASGTGGHPRRHCC